MIHETPCGGVAQRIREQDPLQPDPERNRTSGVFGCEGGEPCAAIWCLERGMLAGLILLAGCNQNPNTSAQWPGAQLRTSRMLPRPQQRAPGGKWPGAVPRRAGRNLDVHADVHSGCGAERYVRGPGRPDRGHAVAIARCQTICATDGGCAYPESEPAEAADREGAPDYKPPLQLDQLHQALLDDLQAANDQQFRSALHRAADRSAQCRR